MLDPVQVAPERGRVRVEVEPDDVASQGGFLGFVWGWVQLAAAAAELVDDRLCGRRGLCEDDVGVVGAVVRRRAAAVGRRLGGGTGERDVRVVLGHAGEVDEREGGCAGEVGAGEEFLELGFGVVVV